MKTTEALEIKFKSLETQVGEDGVQGREQEIERELEGHDTDQQAARRRGAGDQAVGEQDSYESAQNPGTTPPEAAQRAVAGPTGGEVGEAGGHGPPERHKAEQPDLYKSFLVEPTPRRMFLLKVKG